MPSKARGVLLCGLALLAGPACDAGAARPADDGVVALDLAGEGSDCRGFSRDPAEKGPFSAGFSFLTIDDPSRTDDVGGVRRIPVHLWYPVDAEAVDPSSAEAVYPLDPVYAPGHTATSSEVEIYGIDRAYQDPPLSRRGPFPLVLLSPGWSHDPSFYAFYGARLASHGFVVAGLTHPGDGDFVVSPAIPAAKVLYDRPRDLSFALTHLLSESADRKGRWRGLVDRHQVAAMGHSIGGYAALALAGGDDDVCDAANALFGEDYAGPWCAGISPDPRIRAVVRLDASEWALRFRELRRVEVPTITLNEDTDSYVGFCPGENARGHAAISSPVNLRVDVIRSNHQSFTRLCDWLHLFQAKGIIDQGVVDLWTSFFCSDPDPGNGGYPLLDPHLGNLLTSEMVVAFLKTHLARDPGYGRYLTPRWIWNEEPGLGLFLTEVGGESHYGPDQMAICLPSSFANDDEFDFYWYMPPPRGLH